MDSVIADLIQRKQYSLPQKEKDHLLGIELRSLTQFHRDRCPDYRRVLDQIDLSAISDGIPFLPVSLFKNHELMSIPRSEVHKTLTSSGTSGQAVSRIYLDTDTATLQVKALASIISSAIGNQRLPMLIIDSADTLRDREKFSARGAGILGLMNFGRDHHFALRPDLSVDEEKVREFAVKYAGRPKLIFGFTFLVWQAFLQGRQGPWVDLESSFLIHSGGWKKLHDMAIGNNEFKLKLKSFCNIDRVYNFYGMVEQVGSVFLEGEEDLLYPPNFADIIIRDPATFAELPVGRPGVIQVVSLLPKSYPGHSILTEDLGIVEYVDKGLGGRLGKAFRILGRIPQAELRGCSDVVATAAQEAPGRGGVS